MKLTYDELLEALRAMAVEHCQAGEGLLKHSSVYANEYALNVLERAGWIEYVGGERYALVGEQRLSESRVQEGNIVRIMEALRRIQEEGGTGNFVVFVADAKKNYYVQFAAEREKTSLRAEAVSNEFLAPKASLSQEQITQLQLMGWSARGVTGNYYRTWEASSEEERLRIAGEVVRTLEVYGWEPSQPLDVELVLE